MVVGSRLAELIAAYAAKSTCSGVFVSGRDAGEVLTADFVPDADPLFVLASRFDVSVDVDPEGGSVTATVAGRFDRSARHTAGFGCALKAARGDDGVRAAPISSRPASGSSSSSVNSDGSSSIEALPEELDPRLDAALDWAFSEPADGPPRRTRAVVVLREGAIVAERYAAPFDAGTALRGWSMTKSVFNALVGRLVHEGQLDLDAPVNVPAWRENTAAVSFRQLLTMTAGNAFDESYFNPYSDVIQMLLFEPAAGAFAADAGQPRTPGTRWRYASGDTNILSLAIRRHLGHDQTYWSWPRRFLFEPLGMSSAVIERDASGTFVGSSFMLATARDWARFGQLFVQDGVWKGERLLPEGWVALSRTPGANNAAGLFGAHFWLPGQVSNGLDDAIHAIGHDRQYVSIVPSHALVVVRLGLTRSRAGWSQGEFLRWIVERL